MTMPPEASGEPGDTQGQVPPQAPPPSQPPQGIPPQAPPAGQTPPPGAYQQPPPGYQQPPPGYQQPGGQQPGAPADPANTIMLNYWLSVFFAWIPALIFWMMEKDKGDQRATQFHTENLNFSLIRTGVIVVMWIFMLIPFIGWVIGALLGLASLALLVLHLITAISAVENYRKGEKPGFMFNFPIVK